MMTVVCVFNDAELLDRRLRASVEAQDGDVRLVAVDNREGRFRAAVDALHHGAAGVEAGWVAFIHQDVDLLEPGWVACVEASLAELPDLGWAGVAGVGHDGGFRGLLRDSGMVRGAPSDRATPVQTLDECVLVTRCRDDRRYFDPTLRGWHAYGVDACLTAEGAGAVNRVLPAPVWHDSPATNRAGLVDAHRWLWEKHGTRHPVIHTTTGSLPAGLDAPSEPSLPARMRSRLEAVAHRLRGYEGGFRVWCGEAPEAWVAGTERVDVLRARAGVAPLEAAGFVHQPEVERSVLHRFEGLAEPRPGAGVVLHQDLVAHLAATGRAEECLAFLAEHPGMAAVSRVEVEETAPELWAGLGRARRRILALDDQALPVLLTLPE